MFTSVGYPANTVENLELNTLGDGLFHASAYAFILIGLVLVWSGSRLATLRWSTKLLLGGLLAGWGTFNLAEGFVGHHILGIHHVRSGPGQAWWDLGFLAWGAVMLVGVSPANAGGGSADG
jgi:uncharacterized membrane protein